MSCKGKLCFICGKEMSLYKKSNYDPSKVNKFSFAARKMPEYMHYELWECKTCGLLMAQGAPDGEELLTQYEEAAYDSKEAAGYASKTYIKYLKKYLTTPLGGSRAMDIGTGEGSYLKELQKEGVRDIVGIEPSLAPIEVADKEIRSLILNKGFSAEDFSPNSFDMISCFQTIEHIPNPDKLIKDIFLLLNDGGVCYIVCHDYRSLVNRLLGMKSPIYDIEHVQIFSQKSICKLLSKCGFQDIKSFTLRNCYPLKSWVKLFPIPMKIKRSIMKKLEKSKIGQIDVGIDVGNVGVIAWKKPDHDGRS